MEKLCPSCSTIKDFVFFSKSKSRKDGHKCYCKKCEHNIYVKNKEIVAQKNFIYRLNNKEKIQENKKLYSIKNRDKIRDRQRLYKNNKLKSDIGYRIKERLRKRLWDAIRGYNKSDKTMNLLGCDIQQLKIHLESKFKVGMDWDNYGFGDEKWHIDHIIPCDCFDLSIEENQRKCFHYSNLQPLWQIENFRKGNRII